MGSTRESGDFREVEEVELKLQILHMQDQDAFWKIPRLLKGLQSAPVTAQLVSVYYDTPGHDLVKNGYSYRVRQDGETWVATVKGMGTVEGGLHRREEWNTSLPDQRPNLLLLEDETLRTRLASLIKEQPLVPLMTTRFQRTLGIWEHSSGTQVEVALDQGVIETAKVQLPISEVELELKKGSSLELLELGEILSSHVSLVPSDTSKFHRGLQLLGLTDSTSSITASSHQKKLLSKDQARTMTVAQAVSHMLAESFGSVISSFRTLHHEPEKPEHLHQLRVSLRRLRSLLSFLRPVLHQTQAENLRNSLKDWSSRWSPLRELDVLVIHFGEFVKDYETLESPHPAPLLQTLMEQQVALARQTLYEALNHGEMTPQLLGCWRQIKALAVDEGMGEWLLTDFGEQRLRRWVKRFEKKGRHTGLEDVQQLHQLRIMGKKIRYVMEGLAPALPQIPGKKIKTMKKLQELMGELHDVHCETRRMQQWVIDQRAESELMRQAGRYEGWQQQREYAFQQELARFWRKAGGGR